MSLQTNVPLAYVGKAVVINFVKEIHLHCKQQ